MPKSSNRQSPTKRKQQSKHLVFISHSSYDRWIAQVMAEKIKASGADCWLDEKDLLGGDVIDANIIEGINLCTEAIVLISAQSVQSQWVIFEIGGVRAQYKRITPIFNNASPDQIAPLKDIEGIELNNFDSYLEQLKQRISKRERRPRRGKKCRTGSL